MIGKTISHYKILEKIGEGGMGVVYKAQDTKLDRTVALKFISPQTLKTDEEKARFIQEAKAAAAINHANITTIYEINEFEGDTFISMEYIEGNSLKDKIETGPLTIDESLKFAVQIAEGLQEAHEKGIVHRDIKSANIMITEKGQMKIMDFGLAMLKGKSKLTKVGTTVGTADYMSPEQSMGKRVDHRTDIWSLGVVLYEMITGQLPFKGDYEQAVIYSILNEDPEPITDIRTGITQEFEKIINKALVKDPSNRYQIVKEFIGDLMALTEDSLSNQKIIERRKKVIRPKFLAWGALLLLGIIISGYLIFKDQKKISSPEKIIVDSQWKNSVAVLPFRDFSPQKDQEYFCDGMTDAIIGKLSQLKQLKIISLTSVLQYKNQALNIKKIGRELDVETILEGSIQKEGSNIRINAQLIRVTDDSHLWQKTYDKEVKSLFAIQDEISQSIANALSIELLEEEKELLSQHHTRNMDAYNLYMQGRYFWRKRTEEGFKKSIEFYNQALKVDPNFALAYSGLADTYSTMAWGRDIHKQGYAQAKEAALRAIELNNNLAEGHNSLALILLDYEWKFEEAKREFERALELNPGYATALHWYARYFYYMGNIDKAVSILKQALKLDPLSPSINWTLSGLYYLNHQYDRAIMQVKRGIDMHPDFKTNHHLLGLLYLEKHLYKKAMDEFNIFSPLETPFWELVIEAKQGNTKKLEIFLDNYLDDNTSSHISPMEKAYCYSWTGNGNKVFKWLGKAYLSRDPEILNLRIYPHFKNYHTDKRFKKLLKKIGLDK